MLSDNFLKIRTWILLAALVIIFPALIVFAVMEYIYNFFYKLEKSIRGEVAMVTGGANGLGKEIAFCLAAKGCNVAIVDINGDAAFETAKYIRETYSVKSEAFQVNVAQYDEVKNVSKNIEDQLGPVTILVNNAGILSFSTSINTPPSEIQNMVNVNLVAHLWTIRIFLDKMRELKKGHIVAVSSLGGMAPVHRQLEYTATKFAIRGLMGALRTELYALNSDFIKTTTVFPFFLNTNAKVAHMLNSSGISSLFYPLISGTTVAEAVVKGIVRNELEVFVPGFTLFACKLLDLVPKTLYVKIVNEALGRRRLKRLEY